MSDKKSSIQSPRVPFSILSHVFSQSLLALFLAGAIFLTPSAQGETPAASSNQKTVGIQETGQVVVPVNQTVSPAGKQIPLPGMRPQALALSPNGRLLVVSGLTHELVALDPNSGAILQRVRMPSDVNPAPAVASPNILKPPKEGQLSYTGLIFSHKGKRIFLSNVNGSVEVFDVSKKGIIKGLFSIQLPPANAPRRKEEIPAGLALSPDDKKLYVAMNLSNRLGEFDATTGKPLRFFEAGVAPYDVVLVGNKAYVSNWGGGRPQAADLKGPAGRGTEVKISSVTGAACEGSVTSIDLHTGALRTEIVVQLHASALAVSPDRRWVVCANAASDNLSVIDAATDKIIETIWVKPSPAALFGASPNALAFDKKGNRLYVANGTQNAVAVIAFDGRRHQSRFVGLIPVGWFPGALVVHSKSKQLCVANIKGITPQKEKDSRSGGQGFNSHQYHGSLSLVPLPQTSELAHYTEIVLKNYQHERMVQALLPARAGQPPRPIPERIGEPSLFKHVVYIIKENRTYDQVLGAIGKGNGDPSLCIFGERVTPNQHKMAREFILLDNTYCSGILSADGHQWSTTAFGTDYLEKSFAGWPRSYPDGMGENEIDALAYAPTGFIWDNLLKHEKTLRNYGEFALPAVRWADPNRQGEPDWTACWKEFLNSKGEVIFGSTPGVEALRPYLAMNSVGWNLNVPDAFRARYFIQELKEFEKKGEFPNLVLICLPNNHTSGTSYGAPTPAAMVADNDLAMGQIVEALSHSQFWPETVIFSIEDDPQDGWDHVSGYRTAAFCVSPYTKREEVVSSQYNTTSILRTIEQILGLPPMNQFDATATPMFDCFTEKANLTPFIALPNRVPLDEMNPPPKEITDPLLRKNAIQSARLNFKQVDACPEEVLNRILWHAMKGSSAPYPQWATTAMAKDEDD